MVKQRHYRFFAGVIAFGLQIEALNWYAFVAPGKTPAPILDRWNTEIVKVLNDAEVKKALEGHGLTPQPTTRAELTEFMKKEDAKWSGIVKSRNIHAN